MIEPFDIFKEYASCFEHYIFRGEQLCVVVLDEDLCILQCNRSFRQILGTMNSLEGHNFLSLLLPESQHILPFKDSVTHMDIPLNLMSMNSDPLSLECHIYRKNNTYLVLGSHIMLTNNDILKKMSLLTNDMANLMRELSRKNKELEEAQSKIKVLGGIIPICMHCKQIRDDKGYWNQLEKFITENSEAQFSHGICDNCMNTLYPDDES